MTNVELESQPNRLKIAYQQFGSYLDKQRRVIENTTGIKQQRNKQLLIDQFHIDRPDSLYRFVGSEHRIYPEVIQVVKALFRAGIENDESLINYSESFLLIKGIDVKRFQVIKLIKEICIAELESKSTHDHQ